MSQLRFLANIALLKQLHMQGLWSRPHAKVSRQGAGKWRAWQDSNLRPTD